MCLLSSSAQTKSFKGIILFLLVYLQNLKQLQKRCRIRIMCIPPYVLMRSRCAERHQSVSQSASQSVSHSASQPASQPASQSEYRWWREGCVVTKMMAIEKMLLWEVHQKQKALCSLRWQQWTYTITIAASWWCHKNWTISIASFGHMIEAFVISRQYSDVFTSSQHICLTNGVDYCHRMVDLTHFGLTLLKTVCDEYKDTLANSHRMVRLAPVYMECYVSLALQTCDVYFGTPANLCRPPPSCCSLLVYLYSSHSIGWLYHDIA